MPPQTHSAPSPSCCARRSDSEGLSVATVAMLKGQNER